MNETNENRLILYITKLIKDYHLKETDDTYKRDVVIFKNIFPKESYNLYSVDEKEFQSSTFNLKNMNGLKVKFDRIEMNGKLYDYSINISSPIVDEDTFNLITEIEIARKKNDIEFCKGIINSCTDEVYYYAMQFEKKITTFQLNKNETLIFEPIVKIKDTLNFYDCNIYFYDGLNKSLVGKDIAANIIKERYSFGEKIRHYIEKVSKLDILKEKEKLIKAINDDIILFNGEEMLNAMKDMNVIDEQLITLSVMDMLGQVGFFASFPESLEIAFTEKDYLFNKELAQSVEDIKHRIKELHFPEAECTLNGILTLNNKNPKMSSGLRVLNFLNNSKKYLSERVLLNSKKISPTKYFNDDRNKKMNGKQVEAWVKGVNEIFREPRNNTYTFTMAPFVLSDYIIPQIKGLCNKALIMNNMFVREFLTDNEYNTLKNVYNDIINNNSMKVETIQAAMNGLAKIFQITQKVSVNIAHYEREETRMLNEAVKKRKEKESIQKEIKTFMMPKKKNELQKKYDMLNEEYINKTNAHKQYKDTLIEFRKKASEFLKDDYDYRMLTYDSYTGKAICFKDLSPNNIIQIGKDYEKFISRVFVEYPLTALINDNSTLPQFAIRTTTPYGEQKRCCIDSYSGMLLTTNLTDYINDIFDFNLENIKNKNTYEELVKNYIKEAMNCKSINEVEMLVQKFFGDNYTQKYINKEIELDI